MIALYPTNYQYPVLIVCCLLKLVTEQPKNLLLYIAIMSEEEIPWHGKASHITGSLWGESTGNHSQNIYVGKKQSRHLTTLCL